MALGSSRMNSPEVDLRDLERSIRALQLPLVAACESDAASAARDCLGSLRVPTEEQAGVVDADLRDWESSGEPSNRLKAVVRALLRQCGGEVGEVLADGFFDAHRQLITRHELDFPAARRLISNSQLVLHLMKRERMSCAQVARVLSASVRGAGYNWEQVRSVARSLHISIPDLTSQQVTNLAARDRGEQVARFADSAPDVELQLLTEAAEALGFPQIDSAALDRLLGRDFDPAVMTLLHFLLTVCEFHDHPLSVLYEFRPRGDAFSALQEENPRYAAKGSAALNIAKGAFVLDRDWAWVRKGQRRSDALALVHLIEGMEAMHYASRRELAAWLRQLIVRLHERYGSEPRLLHFITAETRALELLNLLIQNPTRTYGTIEQRVVDALSAALHPADQWSSRGGGDSVFATNLSRKKMGDCEYVDRNRPTVVAYEAHAGDLTDAYLVDHEKSLERVLESRREDLEAQHDPQDWAIRVLFVAHRNSVTDLNMMRGIGEYSVEVETIDYGELLERARSKLDLHADGAQRLVTAVNDNLIEPLNEVWIPQSIRDCVLERLD